MEENRVSNSTLMSPFLVTNEIPDKSTQHDEPQNWDAHFPDILSVDNARIDGAVVWFCIEQIIIFLSGAVNQIKSLNPIKLNYLIQHRCLKMFKSTYFIDTKLD